MYSVHADKHGTVMWCDERNLPWVCETKLKYMPTRCMGA